MGNKKRRKEQFLKQHPLCCFCGGETPATTFDHWPSRAVFDGRQWPEEYVFPACAPCNSTTANDETLFALLCRLKSTKESEDSFEQTKKLLIAVYEKRPGLYRSLFPRANQVRNWIKTIKYLLPPGETTKSIPLLSLKHPEINASIARCAAKLFLGLHYKNTGTIIPKAGGVLFKWFTNANRAEETPIEYLLKILPNQPELKWQTKVLDDQFTYRYLIGETNGIASAFLVKFHESIGMAGLIFSHYEKLNSIAPESDISLAFQVLRPFSWPPT